MKNGGVFTQKGVFPYDERPIFRRSFSAWRAVRPTSAVVTSSKLSATSVRSGCAGYQHRTVAGRYAYMILMDHNFKRVRTVTGEADIHYQINSPVVRKNQLSLEQVKLFEAFVRENSAAEDVTMGTVYAKGYASPDGPENFNQKLSAERSKSGEKAIKENLKGIDVQYDAAAYGEDWEASATGCRFRYRDKDLSFRCFRCTIPPHAANRKSRTFPPYITSSRPRFFRNFAVPSSLLRPM